MSHFGIPDRELIHTAVLEAALVRLNVNIPFEDIMKVIREEEEEARRVKYNTPSESKPQLSIPSDIRHTSDFF